MNVVRKLYRGFSWLLNKIIPNYILLRLDIAKLGHHQLMSFASKKTSSTDVVLDAGGGLVLIGIIFHMPNIFQPI